MKRILLTLGTFIVQELASVVNRNANRQIGSDTWIVPQKQLNNLVLRQIVLDGTRK